MLSALVLGIVLPPLIVVCLAFFVGPDSGRESDKTNVSSNSKSTTFFCAVGIHAGGIV